METAGLRRIIMSVVQSVLDGEMFLETIHCLLHGSQLLPLFVCFIVNSCVEYESIGDVDYLLAPIWLLSCLRVCPSVLHLLELIIDRPTGIVRQYHQSIVVHKFYW
jgi:hypothetical protein